MVQKEQQRQRDSSVDTDLSSITSSSTGSAVKGDSLPRRLLSAVAKEGTIEDGAKAGAVMALGGALLGGLTPAFFGLFALLGTIAGGAALGKLMPNKVFSVMGAAGIVSFLGFALFGGAPLGIIGGLVFTVLATGGAVAAYQKTEDSSRNSW